MVEEGGDIDMGSKDEKEIVTIAGIPQDAPERSCEVREDIRLLGGKEESKVRNSAGMDKNCEGVFIKQLI